MNRVIGKKDLEKLENFIGYGREDAKIIFFGLEEAGGGWENLKKRIKIEDYRFLDCKRFHLDNLKHTKPYKLHSDDPDVRVKFQNVWKFMSYLMLRLDNVPKDKIFLNKSRIHRDYQNNKLGTKGKIGETLLTEIFPIPCSNLKKWGAQDLDYTEIITQYKNKSDYQKKVLDKRIQLFKKILKSKNFKARAIVCYGKTHWKQFKKFFIELDVQFEERELTKKYMVGDLPNGTKVFLIPFLGYGQVSYKFLDELAKKIPNRKAINLGDTGDRYDNEAFL